jgi:hypothetical protein
MQCIDVKIKTFLPQAVKSKTLFKFEERFAFYL